MPNALPSAAPLFPAHIEEIGRRTGAALAASGYDGLVLHAGEAIDIFLDDHHYPFKAHAPFKWWAPLRDAPGSLVWVRPGRRPTLIFRVETDFWYQPASLPESGWPTAFEVVTVRSRAEARAALPGDLSRHAWIGDALPELPAWGLGAVNPPGLMARLDHARAARPPTRSPACAKPTASGPGGIARPRPASARAAASTRSTRPSPAPAASASRSCRTTRSWP